MGGAFSFLNGSLLSCVAQIMTLTLEKHLDSQSYCFLFLLFFLFFFNPLGRKADLGYKSHYHMFANICLDGSVSS